MGFSIAGSQNTSTLLAELSFAETADGQEMEGILPEELPDSETQEGQAKEGMLRGGSRNLPALSNRPLI